MLFSHRISLVSRQPVHLIDCLVIDVSCCLFLFGATFSYAQLFTSGSVLKVHYWWALGDHMAVLKLQPRVPACQMLARQAPSILSQVHCFYFPLKKLLILINDKIMNNTL